MGENRVFILYPTGEQVKITELERGDMFAMFDDGEPIEDGDGNNIYFANGEAFIREGVWVIDCEGIEYDEYVSELLLE